MGEGKVQKSGYETMPADGCYLCGGRDLAVRPGTVRDRPELEIYECNSCGLVFLSSHIHINDIFYANSGMHEGNVDMSRWIRETYPDDSRRYCYLKQMLEGKDVLDYGCGAGGFLKLARDTAKSVAGIEPDRSVDSVFAAEKIMLWHSLEEVNGYFDLISLFHVLEHLPDPVASLGRLADHLKDDGCLIAEVPNADDALLDIYGCEAFANFTYWSCHLFLFNPFTLEKAAKKAGLQVRYIKQIQRYPLSNHLYWLAQGKPGGHRSWGFLDSPELNQAYEKQLAAVGKCDTLIACFFR